MACGGKKSSRLPAREVESTLRSAYQSSLDNGSLMVKKNDGWMAGSEVIMVLNKYAT